MEIATLLEHFPKRGTGNFSELTGTLAKQMLEARDEPLERVVERCGYADVSSFRKLFAREVGMTPREYRLRFQR